jgi:hypothetical protein
MESLPGSHANKQWRQDMVLRSLAPELVALILQPTGLHTHNIKDKVMSKTIATREREEHACTGSHANVTA